MRIASVAFTNYDADPRVRRMSEALVDRGDDVIAVTLQQPGKARRRVVSGVKVHGIGIRQYKGSSLVSYLLQYVSFLFLAGWHVTRLHLRSRFDVVHVNNMPDFLVFAALPARLLGAKVILDLHDPMPELYASKFATGKRHPAVKIITGIERLSIAFADRALCVQQVHLETFVSHGNDPAKFVEVQNAADTQLFPVGAALGEVKRGSAARVIYHGTIAPRLGLGTLIEASSLLSLNGAKVEVVLIGDGDDADRIESLIDTYGVHDIVDFRRGFIPVDELLPELLTADIGVVPAGRDPFTEGMLPSKLLEYVTLGVPTACADLPAVRRYFGTDAVAFFPPGDAEALAATLEHLIEHPAERQEHAKAALRFLDDHGWPSERDRYLELVDELAAS